MKITTRLTVMLAVAILATLLTGAVGLVMLEKAQQRFEFISTSAFPSLINLNGLQQTVMDQRLAINKMLVAQTQEQKDTTLATLADTDKRFNSLTADYLANDVGDETDKQMLQADQAAMNGYRAMRDKALDLVKANQRDQAVGLLLGDGATLGKTLLKGIDDHFAYNVKLAQDQIAANRRAYDDALILSASIIVLSSFAMAVLGWQLYRIIKNGLYDMQDTMSHVSQSLDFTHRTAVQRQDELGQTASAFNALLERLQHNLKSILDGAHNVAKASQEMRHTAGEVSTASQAQSNAASNIAATIEQMTVSINHVADQAKSTREMAQEAGNLAQEGSRIIGQTIQDIREISNSVKTSAESIRKLVTYSSQVSSVINVIREIADQTNLLALNAAIEAARAGEQGRGFAVVADEVRKLAERTAKSTTEIADTIQTMVALSQEATAQMVAAESNVENGVKRADEADAAIHRIGDTSGSTAGMVNEISHAIVEQGVASNNIATQVEHSAQMSEQSSAAAHNTASTAQRVDELARAQIETLSRYRL
ncbi:MAG: methyl-accepting chemotaxis protein [Paludibacterium sp.]|uniref:methyl-accepting chemotaxis protein n=1 Tax=Paludibacterium sp. TaxID=1917523 RepID=UPI0025EC18E6|nr:methyl-accepting chemotaxis protein [Paludibacterium sp.]MBV8048042.1 methyl-accepting chemotaxis protein [Paludibacterium sp.]MBV8647566.1 methyl-accepting chemotaxis protein [Paludibacterium sp.]